MTDRNSGPSEMEKLLGRKFSRTRTVPGLTPKPGRQFQYIEFSGSHEAFGEFFNELVNHKTPTAVARGGSLVENCQLSTPDGRSFYAVSYKGDLEGWNTQISAGAQALQTATAQISEETLCASDGTQWQISDCQSQFY